MLLTIVLCCLLSAINGCVYADGKPSTHVVQNLSFQLGQYDSGVVAEKKPMALVCKLSRGHYMPPPFTSVQDWFHYAFATSEIKGENAKCKCYNYYVVFILMCVLFMIDIVSAFITPSFMTVHLLICF